MDLRKRVFTDRVVKHWNLFLSDVVESPSLGVLKNRLDAVLRAVI